MAKKGDFYKIVFAGSGWILLDENGNVAEHRLNIYELINAINKRKIRLANTDALSFEFRNKLWYFKDNPGHKPSSAKASEGKNNPIKKGYNILLLDDKDIPISLFKLKGKKLKVKEIKEVYFASGNQNYYVVEYEGKEYEIPERFIKKDNPGHKKNNPMPLKVLKKQKFYHARFIEPVKGSEYATPDWAEKVADSVYEGSEVTMMLLPPEEWYDSLEEDELDGILRELGWKPYKFKVDGIYPVWNKLGEGYGTKFGNQLRKELTTKASEVKGRWQLQKVMVPVSVGTNSAARAVAKKIYNKVKKKNNPGHKKDNPVSKRNKTQTIQYLESLGLKYKQDFQIEEKWLDSFNLFIPKDSLSKVESKIKNSEYKLESIGVGFDYNRNGYIKYLEPAHIMYKDNPGHKKYNSIRHKNIKQEDFKSLSKFYTGKNIAYLDFYLKEGNLEEGTEKEAKILKVISLSTDRAVFELSNNEKILVDLMDSANPEGYIDTEESLTGIGKKSIHSYLIRIIDNPNINSDLLTKHDLDIMVNKIYQDLKKGISDSELYKKYGLLDEEFDLVKKGLDTGDSYKDTAAKLDILIGFVGSKKGKDNPTNYELTNYVEYIVTRDELKKYLKGDDLWHVKNAFIGQSGNVEGKNRENFYYKVITDNKFIIKQVGTYKDNPGHNNPTDKDVILKGLLLLTVEAEQPYRERAYELYDKIKKDKHISINDKGVCRFQDQPQYKLSEARRIQELSLTDPELALKEAKRYVRLFKEDKDLGITQKFGTPIDEILGEYQSIVDQIQSNGNPGHKPSLGKKDNPGDIDWHSHPGYTHDKTIIKDGLLDLRKKVSKFKDEERGSAYYYERIRVLIDMINSGRHVMINDKGICQYQNSSDNPGQCSSDNPGHNPNGMKQISPEQKYIHKPTNKPVTFIETRKEEYIFELPNGNLVYIKQYDMQNTIKEQPDLSENTMKDLRESWGLDSDDKSKDDEILSQPIKRRLEQYMNWVGIEKAHQGKAILEIAGLKNNPSHKDNPGHNNKKKNNPNICPTHAAQFKYDVSKLFDMEVNQLAHNPDNYLKEMSLNPKEYKIKGKMNIPNEEEEINKIAYKLSEQYDSLEQLFKDDRSNAETTLMVKEVIKEKLLPKFKINN